MLRREAKWISLIYVTSSSHFEYQSKVKQNENNQSERVIYTKWRVFLRSPGSPNISQLKQRLFSYIFSITFEAIKKAIV